MDGRSSLLDMVHLADIDNRNFEDSERTIPDLKTFLFHNLIGLVVCSRQSF